MPRYSLQQQQEDLSRNQLGERFNQVGCVLDGISRDLGEDLIGRVYEIGESTGLSFLIQLKSVKSIQPHKKKNDVVSYSFKVKDLTHWEVSSTSTILIVWDVKTKTGYWVSVVKAIAILDKENPSWRKSQTSATIHFSSLQDTSDNGFVGLRLLLIEEAHSFISRWFMKEGSAFVFPKTPEADKDLQTFLHGRSTGERVTLNGNYLQLGEREQRLLGPILNWDWEITVGTPPAPELHPVKLEVESSTGEIAKLDFIELQLVKKGTDEFTYSNGHHAVGEVPERKASPLLISLIQRNQEDFPHFTLSTENSWPTAQQIKETLPFLDSFVAGGKFRLTYLKHQNRDSSWTDVPAQGLPSSIEYSLLIDTLCAIQDRANVIFHVPDWKVSRENAMAANNALSILATGRCYRSGVEASFPLNKTLLKSDAALMEKLLSDLSKTGGYVSFQVGPEQQSIELLGISVPLGVCIGRISGQIELSIDDLRAAVLAESPNGEVSLKLRNTTSIVESLTTLEMLDDSSQS